MKNILLKITINITLLLLICQPVWALSDGVYTIGSKVSNKLIEVGNADINNGANVNQWPANGHPTQHWLIKNINANEFAVINANSGKALEVYNFDSSDGANVVQYEYWGGTAQIWQITDLGNGYYSFINKHTGKSLDLYNADTADGANIAQWTHWGGDPQQWLITPVADINYVAPSFTNTAVHDPSIIVTNEQYYVFGSHLAAAKSSDMQNWTRFADGVTAQNPLFNDVTADLSEALTWAETNTLWAPDIAYVNGRFLMYYNACRGDAPRSTLGIAASTSIEGPYYDEGLLLSSGMWGEPSEDGNIYDAMVHPNAVDPAVFYAQDGSLWMMYGSYSGGIFILALDPSTGRPYAGQGYGTHLLGGNHARIEGAYVIYAPETGFYYMFVSYGGLSADGGYNIRVSRSSNPNGPYFDANGTNMANVKSDPNLPLFDDASIAPHGVKLMGNHVFTNSNNELGYVSPGHNSAWRNPSSGQYFLFFHTRFPNRGEEHEVRVHEFFFNDAGWPVVAPLRYAAKQDASNPNRSQSELDAINYGQLPGLYQFVNHGKDISDVIKQSVDISLEIDGSVTGGVSGTWAYNTANQSIVLVLNGTSYQGKASRQWNQSRHRFEISFSALSQDGTAVWGIRSN